MIKTDSVRDRIISKPQLLYNNESSINVILVSNYKFESESDNELSVNKGDLLKYIEKKPNGWVLVKFLDKLNDPGLIPASYVDIVINDIKTPITLAWLNDDDDLDLPIPSDLNSPPRSMKKNLVKDIRDMHEPVPLRNSDRVKNFDSNASNLRKIPPPTLDTNHGNWSSGLDSKYDRTKAAVDSKRFLHSGKRSNSDINDYKQKSFIKPRNNSEPKLLNSRDNNTYLTFNNPYLQQGIGGFKDFKADSFNKFSPPVSPIIPITQNSHQIQMQEPQTETQSSSQPIGQSRSNSNASTQSHGSFGSLSLNHRKGSSVSSSGRINSQDQIKQNYPPRNGSISNNYNPRISNPISFSNPISPVSPTDNKSTLRDGNIPKEFMIDFNSKQYHPINKLKSISISNCLLHNDRYWYRIDLRYACQKVSIGKFYHDFYNLQLSLMDSGYSKLPKLPAPIELNDNDDGDGSDHSFDGGDGSGVGGGDAKIDKFLKRCNEVNNYLNKLIKLDYHQFNDWINFNTNKHYCIYNINHKNEPLDLSNNDVNEKILPGSINLLYKPLNLNLINGNTTVTFDVNKNEINSLKILKDLVNEKVNFNHLLIKYNGKFDLIDQINWEFIKSQSCLELRII